MKVLEINGDNHGSTGNLMQEIAMLGRDRGYDVITSCPKSRTTLNYFHENEIVFGSITERNIHRFLGLFTGRLDLFSGFSTMQFINRIEKFSPDIIHLHNLHGEYINIQKLFEYIISKNIRIVWTLHDCWPFTGKCPHFIMHECYKWRDGCYDCPALKDYPKTKRDYTSELFQIKKKFITSVKDIIFIAPSQWIANYAKQSIAKNCDIRVIHNGINLNIFYPRVSNFRDKYNCDNKFLILSVMYNWGKQKGSDVVVELSKQLDDSYQIVYVGSDDVIDTYLPNNVIKIHKTRDQNELAEIYSACDLFINPTRQEVFGLVNIESLACGTPVLTFNTGGCPECIDKSCGIVVEQNDIEGMIRNINRVRDERLFSTEACRKRAEKFNSCDVYNDYVNVYEELYARN